jgi:hypothetical protein
MHFPHSWHSKKRFRRSRGSDDWSRRMALRTNYLPLGRLKKRLCEVNEAMYQEY